VTQIYLFIKIILETSQRRIFFCKIVSVLRTPINLNVSSTQPEGITSESNDQWQISRWLSTESKACTYFLSLSLSSSHSAIRYRDVSDKLSAQPCVAHDAFSPLVVIAKLRNHYAPRLSLIDKFDGSVVIYYILRGSLISNCYPAAHSLLQSLPREKFFLVFSRSVAYDRHI